MPDLCGDKHKKKKERKKWVGQAHTVEKVGGPLAHMAHTVPPPVEVGIGQGSHTTIRISLCL